MNTHTSTNLNNLPNSLKELDYSFNLIISKDLNVIYF